MHMMLWETIETRHCVALLLCLANALCYAARTNIGIAAPAFLPDPSDRGLVLSSFFYGYILTQIPSSVWAARRGAKAVLLSGVLLMTACDITTVFVSHSIPRLVMVRAVMGAGQGVLMSSLSRFAADWFPAAERGTLFSMTTSGSSLGTIFALSISPYIMERFHWKVIFVAFGCCTIVWAILFSGHVASTPGEHARITEKEREYIQSSVPPSATCDMPWSVAFGSKSLWAIYAAHFCFNYSWYVLLGWLPSYLKGELGLDLKENSFLAALPYVCGYFGMMTFGRVSDYLISRRGMQRLRVRRIMNTVSSAVPAAALLALRHVQTPLKAVLCLSISMFAGSASAAGYLVNMIDVGPAHAGQVMGVSNTIATIPGILGNLITGYVLKRTNDWAIVFNVASFVSLLGGVVFVLFSTDRNVFGKNEKEYKSSRPEEI